MEGSLNFFKERGECGKGVYIGDELSKGEGKSMGEVRIRRATLKDYKDIKRIQQESHPTKELRWGLMDILMERLKRGEEYVIDYGREAVGFIHIRYKKGDHFHILNTCILPRHQGSGIGKVAIGWVKEHYRGRGVKILTAKTSDKNYKTINLCKGLGFIEESRVTGYYEDGSSAINLRIKLN